MRSLAGTGALIRLILRRDRVRIVIWVGALGGLRAYTGSSVKGIYRTRPSWRVARTAGSNAASWDERPGRGLGTLGGRVVFEIWQLSVAVALMAVLMVGRHTRTEEESGRAELVRAAVVGRHAHSAAAMAVVSGMSLAIGAGLAAASIGIDLPVGGSVVLGAAIAMLGVAFGAIGLLTAQITEHGRTATGIAAGWSRRVRAARRGRRRNGVLSWASRSGGCRRRTRSPATAGGRCW